MGVSVLGPVELDGASLSPRARTALCALVLRRPRAVTVEELADASWGPDPPATWPKQVQATVGHLRKALPGGAVITGSGGYRLALARSEVDVDRFEDGVARARELVAAGELDRAAHAYRQALALWRGAPYADLDGWEGAASEVARLAELRATCEEDLLEAELGAGEHVVVASEARSLLERDPFRERRWAILALAQYRCGRQADALRTLRDARRLLADELGVDPGHQLAELERQMLNHDPALVAPVPPPPVQPVCPYRGLPSFGVEDGPQFFGRTAEVEACLRRLRSTPLLVIAGPSGAGKSSLARAGVAAALSRPGAEPVVLLPGRDPVGALVDAVGDAPDGAPVVVDQLEDLFLGGHTEPVVREFCRLLAATTATRQVVVTIRADQIAGLGTDPRLARLAETGLYLVRTMSDDQLREAIEEPAKLAGLRLEPGLVELLVREANGGTWSLPLLSHALVETWRRRDGAMLTVDGYRASGGISASVANAAERIYGSYREPERAACRSVLLRLVTMSVEGGAIHRRQPMRALGLDASRERVVNDLARARLLTVDGSTVEIAHESLVQAWPRLRSWLDDDAAGVRILRHLTTAANAWDSLGRPEGELYRGARLDVALEWRAARGGDLTPIEGDFLDAAQARREADDAQVARRAARDARQNRRLRASLGAVAALLVGAVVAAGIAGVSRADANRARRTAELQALVNQSITLQSTNRDVAALLAVEAYRRAPGDPRARSALLATFTGAPGFVGYRRVPDAARIAGAAVPGTATAVVVVDAMTPELLSTDDATVIRTFAPVARMDQGPRPMVRVSADGARVAIQIGASLTVDEIATGRRLLGPVMTGPLGDLALSPDGRTVVTSDGDTGELTARRVVDGTVAAAATSTGPAAVAYDDSGHLVAGDATGALRVLDPTSLVTLRTITAPADASERRAVGAGRDLVVLVGDSRMVAVVPSTGELAWTATVRADATCAWLAAAPAQGLVFCGDHLGVVRERNLADGAPTGGRLDIQLGDVGELSVAQGELVVIGGAAPVLARWNVEGSGPATRLVARGQVMADGYSPDGLSFISATRAPRSSSSDGLASYAVWDPHNDALVRKLPPAAVTARWLSSDTAAYDVQGENSLRAFDIRSGHDVDGLSVPLVATVRSPWVPQPPKTWVSARGDRLYAALSGDVYVGDTATGQWIPPVMRGKDQVLDVAATGDGSLIAVAFYDNHDTTWQALDGVLRTYVQMFDRATGRALGRSWEHASAIALTDDGLLAVAYRGAITLLDGATMQPVRTLPGAGGSITDLQFSRDGSVLLATADDQTVNIYDVAAGVRLGTPLSGAAPEPLASAVDGSSAIVIAPPTYPGYLRPDGAAALVSVAQGVAEWDLDPAHLSVDACRLAGRNLSRSEWVTYGSALGSYRRTCPAEPG